MSNKTTLPGKALIVDDEKTNRLILKKLLQKQGYETLEAEDGQQAVEQFRNEIPDIVFMDVMMPVMDGYEATVIIKQESSRKFVPVIFLTAMTDEESLAKCIEVGGDDFLVKPYDRFILQTKIKAMQRIAALNKEVQGMYSMIHREQEIAESVFVNAIQSTNIENEFLKHVVRPAGVFSGDMILSTYTPSRDLLFLTGDFTGHGLSAALGAMPVSEVFRAMASKGFSPEEILIGINKKLKAMLPVGMFFGAQMVVVNHDLEHVRIFNAGMPEVLIVDGKSNRIKHEVASNGLPLGVIDNINPKEMGQFFPINSGDKILLYSDGLIEARNVDDEEFGSKRLSESIESAPTDQIFDHVFSRLDDFCGDQTEQADDVTLVEVTCVHDLLPQIEQHEHMAPVAHHFQEKGDWAFSIEFVGKRLKETNPVPILVNQIIELEEVEKERQSLFTVLTELYVNALDHGVLGLDSQLKSDPDGFRVYFEEREKRLSSLSDGYVAFTISVEQIEGRRSMLMRVADSGKGFDYDGLELPAEDELALSGRGLILIKDLCESLTYLGNGNTAEAVYSWTT